MMKNYIKFNESNYSPLNVYQRVKTHGKIKNLEFGDIDINNKTGVVIEFSYDSPYIAFDNYFSFDTNSLLNRCLIVPNANIEIIEIPSSNKQITFSNDATKLFETFEILGQKVDLDIDYIDITDENDTISYLASNRINRAKIEKSLWLNKYRQKMKIGKFIQLFNPYTDNVSLQKKVNMYKLSYDHLISKRSTFKIVSGYDIVNWYNENNYFQGYGSLNKSCMKYDYCSNKLDLYAKNKDIVSMLILIDDNNKLLGRALIWNVNKPSITYMDRIYTVFESDDIRFTDFADDNGWYTYDEYRDNSMIIYLPYDAGNSNRNPYMDTFSFFVIEGDYGKNYLTNSLNHDVDDYYIYDQL